MANITFCAHGVIYSLSLFAVRLYIIRSTHYSKGNTCNAIGSVTLFICFFPSAVVNGSRVRCYSQFWAQAYSNTKISFKVNVSKAFVRKKNYHRINTPFLLSGPFLLPYSLFRATAFPAFHIYLFLPSHRCLTPTS